MRAQYLRKPLDCGRFQIWKWNQGIFQIFAISDLAECVQNLSISRVKKAPDKSRSCIQMGHIYILKCVSFIFVI